MQVIEYMRRFNGILTAITVCLRCSLRGKRGEKVNFNYRHLLLGLCCFLTILSCTADKPSAEKEKKVDAEAAALDSIQIRGNKAWQAIQFDKAGEIFGQLLTEENKKTWPSVHCLASVNLEKMNLYSRKSTRKASYFDDFVKQSNQGEYGSARSKEDCFGRALRLRSTYHTVNGNYESSIKSVNMAIASFSKTKRDSLLGWSYMRRGENHMSLGEKKKAAADLKKGRDYLQSWLKETKEQDAFLAYYHRSMARLKAMEGKVEEARKELQTGLKVTEASKPNLPYARMMIYSDLAALAIRDKKFDDSEKHLDKVMGIAKGTDMAPAMEAMATVLRKSSKQKSFAETEKAIKKIAGSQVNPGMADRVLSLIKSN